MTRLDQILSSLKEKHASNGFLHTSTEIAQQPETWTETATLFQTIQPELQSFLKSTRSIPRTVFLIGAGTSDYIGQAIAPLLRQRWLCEVRVTPSTDLLTQRENLLLADKEYLWVHFSRSGDSPEGVAVLEQALEDHPEILHIVVTCNASGHMAKLAERSSNAFTIVLADKVNDRSLAMTSSFTNMVLIGQGLANLWEENPFSALDPMVQAAEYLLDEGAALASDLAASTSLRACFLGTGALAATARESALKMLELTAGGIVTMWESSLGLRHGPMSALNRDTLLVSFVSSTGNAKRYDLDVLQEIRAKEAVGKSVAVGSNEAAADYCLFIGAFQQIPDLYRPPVDVIFGQLLGFFSSIHHGLAPDKPSPQGVITRVVPPFPIYR